MSTRISKEMINEQCGLNLSYEVRDGIVSHCGENYEEYVLKADKTKRPEDIYTCDHRHNMPYTLEACVVRIVDKIAYVGRDIEDAIRARLMDYSDISGEIRAELGATNGKMIDTLVQDLIENSYDTDYIRLSDARGEALRDMILTNNKYIYRAKMISRYENNADNAIEGLFEAIYPILKEQGIYLAAQCCEHLNRALVIEKECAQKYGYEAVCVVPQPKAGGSFATLAYENMSDPVVVERIDAHFGIDIGDTLIGMHLKRVAVPVRLSVDHIGNAILLCARTRPKYIGGERAVYPV